MIPPETREKLSQQASKRQRDERGHFLPKPDPAVRIAELEAENSRFCKVLNEVAHSVQDAGFGWELFEDLPLCIYRLDEKKNAERLARYAAEERYITLQSQRTTEFAITWTLVPLIVLPLAAYIGHLFTTQGVWK